MKTKLNYLEEQHKLIEKAEVLSIESEEIDGRNHYKMILNQTIFYPQGGGQPSDKGYIKKSTAIYQIEKVSYDREINEIVHYGYFKQGRIEKSDRVTLHVEEETRLINSKYHSAGHIVDLSVKQLNLDWKPKKGYHYPQGAYVEYEISEKVPPEDREELKQKLETKANQIIKQNLKTESLIVENKQNLEKYLEEIPDYLPENKPIRIVRYGENPYTPCGGTHIKNTLQLGELQIRKLKFKGDNVRVSYKLV